MSQFVAKVKVFLTAVPTWGASVASVLTVVAVDVVPHLPGSWQVKVGALAATGLAWVATVTGVVARVTPILFPEDKGLLPADPLFVSDEGPDDWDQYIEDLYS